MLFRRIRTLIGLVAFLSVVTCQCLVVTVLPTGQSDHTASTTVSASGSSPALGAQRVSQPDEPVSPLQQPWLLGAMGVSGGVMLLAFAYAAYSLVHGRTDDLAVD